MAILGAGDKTYSRMIESAVLDNRSYDRTSDGWQESTHEEADGSSGPKKVGRGQLLIDEDGYAGEGGVSSTWRVVLGDMEVLYRKHLHFSILSNIPYTHTRVRTDAAPLADALDTLNLSSIVFFMVRVTILISGTF